MLFTALDKQTRCRWVASFLFILLVHIAGAMTVAVLVTPEKTVGVLEHWEDAMYVDMVAAAPAPAPAVRSATAARQRAQSAPESAAAEAPIDEVKPESVEREALQQHLMPDANSAVDDAVEPLEQSDLRTMEQLGISSDEASAAKASAKARWHQRVRSYLEEQKRFPRKAVVRRQQGVAIVHVIVDRHGNVLSSTLVNSSGYDILDRAAVDLFAIASPLPPPPAQAEESALVMDIPIDYSLN